MAEADLPDAASSGFFLSATEKMMMESREAAVNYMMPLGLHHICSDIITDPNLGAKCRERVPTGLPGYYHKADKVGVGFDRSKTGSNAVAQYQSPLCDLYDDANVSPT